MRAGEHKNGVNPPALACKFLMAPGWVSAPRKSIIGEYHCTIGVQLNVPND